nr:GIY-YIG nuclease family protein [Flavilitoribacter sp.]
MTTEDFKLISDTVPKDPGVYRFFDEAGKILYVGKAKNLRNRVSSYFGERQDRAHKTRVMVKHAHRIEFTIVETEADALLLENTLIGLLGGLLPPEQGGQGLDYVTYCTLLCELSRVWPSLRSIISTSNLA